MKPQEPKRFWSKVDVGDPSECWEWLTSKDQDGYSQFEIRYKGWKAHRVAWVLTYGAIPEGLCVLHKCDNPSCCNPYHLFLGTHKDNMIDAAKKGRRPRKLTVADVLDIRELYATGDWTQKALAAEFDVARTTIRKILVSKTYRWLQKEEVSS